MKKFIILIICLSVSIFSSCTDKLAKEEQSNLFINSPDKTIWKVSDYEKALSKNELEEALETAKKYYGKETIWQLKSIKISQNDVYYQNEGIEDAYKPGELIIFDVIAYKGEDVTERVISVIKNSEGKWEVINEGIY